MLLPIEPFLESTKKLLTFFGLPMIRTFWPLECLLILSHFTFLKAFIEIYLAFEQFGHLVFLVERGKKLW